MSSPFKGPGAAATTLVPGQVLARTLFDPTLGHSLLAAGSVLTALIISKIEQLGLVDEALRCLNASPAAPAPVPEPARARKPAPKPASRQAPPVPVPDARTREPGPEPASRQAPPPSASVPTDPVKASWALIQRIVQRIQTLDDMNLRGLRVQGGGAMIRPINAMLTALHLGLAMRLSPDELQGLAQAALFLDLGSRTRKGAFPGARLARLTTPAREAIESRFERWDGTGWPAGLEGRQIPLAARIIAIADVYETLLIDQVGRARLRPEDAYREILAMAGSAFDPAVVQVFKHVVVPYPVNSEVGLDSGTVAKVVALGDDRFRPVVKPLGAERELDLAKPGSPAITRAVYPRRFRRIARVFSVWLRLPGEPGAFPGCTLNLSEGGACVVLDAKVEPGTPVSVSIRPPGASCLELAGLVVWARAVHGKICLGVSFPPMPALLRAGLADLCHA